MSIEFTFDVPRDLLEKYANNLTIEPTSKCSFVVPNDIIKLYTPELRQTLYKTLDNTSGETSGETSDTLDTVDTLSKLHDDSINLKNVIYQMNIRLNKIITEINELNDANRTTYLQARLIVNQANVKITGIMNETISQIDELFNSKKVKSNI